MTSSRSLRARSGPRVGLAGLIGMVTALAAACTGVTSPSVPTAPSSVPGPMPAGASEVEAEPPSADASCDPEASSLRPTGPLPAPNQMPPGSTMREIQERGRLIVGVDQNTYQFGFRDPVSGDLQGFDIDIAREIAEAIFGDRDAINFTILTSAQRIPALENGDVDIVVRTMTITCSRLQEIDFSSVYYQAAQQVLVKKKSGIQTAEDLNSAENRVCATHESTSLANLAATVPEAVTVGVPDWTDCLVLLQQGQVNAISTDDTILAGFAAQDPFTEVLPDVKLSDEPYGIGIPDGDDEMVRFVNGVLEQLRSSGRWQQIYDFWLEDLLGPTSPPAAQYRN